MARLLEWSIPGWVLLLVVVGVYELVRKKHQRRRGTPLSGTYTNEFTAMLYGTKRLELDHQDSVLMLREEDAQGDRPRHGVNLDRGTVVLRPRSPGSHMGDGVTTDTNRYQ